MNLKKIKIIIIFPNKLIIFSFVFLFILFFQINATQAACSYSSKAYGFNCGKIGKATSTPANCAGQAIPTDCVSDISNCECCCDQAAAPVAPPADMPKLKMPELQISIPGLIFTKIEAIKCEKDDKGKPTNCAFPWIGEYIAGVYKYAIGIVGILAAVVLMIGGVIWIVAGGSATMIGEAKAWIGASLTGLVIALCSYVILYQVNPALVGFQPLNIGIVQEIEGDTTSPLDINYFQNSQNAKLPTSGSVKDIVLGSKGKVTYGRSDKSGDCSGKGQQGPNGTICYDCSGFVKYVIKTAYNKDIPDGTYNIFSGMPLLDTSKINNLTAGTLIGWSPESGKSGHVLISLGDGTFADSHGGTSGRQPGNAIGTYTAQQILDKYGNKNLKIREI